MAEDGESGFVEPSVYNPYQSQTIVTEKTYCG